MPKAVDMSVPVAVADGKHAFEATVTASDGRILSKGADIYIPPQKKDKLRHVESWRTVGYELVCEDYVRLDKPVIAVGTERIDVKVSLLHDGILGGRLRLVVMMGAERASVEVLRGERVL